MEQSTAHRFPSITFARTPELILTAGALDMVGSLASRYGKRILLITGGKSLRKSNNWLRIQQSLHDAGLYTYPISVATEPSPRLVDSFVEQARSQDVDCVVSIGGGSVLDCGKALAAMTPLGEPVIDYLEGVGNRKHPGVTLPHIAMPTTAGTGSEATKNAVLSSIGSGGFKKSLRHDNFVPVIALIDPLLQVTCPPSVTAACGLDAFTQLLESYVSTKATPLSDALALSGLKELIPALVPAATTQGENLAVRSALSYGAYLSGLTLANAGLGVIHGIASPLGALVPIPHGVVCGSLLAAATKATINALLTRKRSEPYAYALEKYASIGALFGGEEAMSVAENCARLIEGIEAWTQELNIPRLSSFGIKQSDLEEVARQSSSKNNPFHFDSEAIGRILLDRL